MWLLQLKQCNVPHDQDNPDNREIKIGLCLWHSFLLLWSQEMLRIALLGAGLLVWLRLSRGDGGLSHVPLCRQCEPWWKQRHKVNGADVPSVVED